MRLFKKKYPAKSEISGDGPWAVLQGQNNGHLMIVRSNQGLSNCVGHPEYPYRVGIAIPLLAPDDDGLPSGAEGEQLNSIEDAICKEILNDNESLIAVIITTSGMREFVFYTSSPEQVKLRFEKVKGLIETHQLQMIIRLDKGWEVYKQFSGA